MRTPPREFTTHLLGSLLVVAGLASLACGDRGAAEETPPSRPIPAVEVVQAREGVLPLVERVTGTVRAAGEVAIFPETSGPIVEVLAENGDAVRKGEPLVRIQAAGSQAQLQQARSNVAVSQAQLEEIEANLQDLRTQYERSRVLGERGLVPRETVTTQRSQVEAMEASLARARAQVAAARAAVAERSEVQRQTVVRAPISGRVGQRHAEVGMRVDPQTQLYVIGSLDQMRVEAPVTQEILTELRAGQRVELWPGERSADPIPAQISRISPFLEPGSFSAEVEIDVPNEGRLVPGMFVPVDISYGESERATLVPTSAVYESPTTGERGVFVAGEAAMKSVEGGRLSADPVALAFRPVEVRADGRQTVAVSGVQAGEWVVVIGQHLLSPQSGDEASARVRPLDWDQVLDLQRLQREDLLREFMERQRRIAASTDGSSER
jgi:RND family efflux transporter MFP subunit